MAARVPEIKIYNIGASKKDAAAGTVGLEPARAHLIISGGSEVELVGPRTDVESLLQFLANWIKREHRRLTDRYTSQLGLRQRCARAGVKYLAPTKKNAANLKKAARGQTKRDRVEAERKAEAELEKLLANLDGEELLDQLEDLERAAEAASKNHAGEV